MVHDRKRDKIASYFSGLLSHHDSRSLDNEGNDFKEMRDLIMLGRRNLAGQRGSRNTRQNLLNSPHLRLIQMPTEVLLQVFKYLDKSDLYLLLTVCREFSDLIVEIMWFRPNMQSDSAFHKVRQVMEQPKESTHWDYRNYIKRLNLSFMTKLVDDRLLDLFVGCPKLERLTLVNCTKLTHAPITRVLNGCDRLQLIDMTGVQDIQDDIILALAEHCPRLQGLYAPGCGNVSENAIITLLQACPMLKRIKFNNTDNITNDSILAMYENCKLLVEIDLHNCPNVTDRWLKHIFADLTQLREFRILKAVGVTDNLFELVPSDQTLEKLRIIDVTECNAISDNLVERMVRCAPRLRNVILSKCMQITDASLRHLTKLGRSLHYVHLGHCVLITDFGVQALVRACHRIQYIDLACCTQLTDWTLIELLNLPKLRRIGLVKCNLILDLGIMELVRRRGEQDCLERVHLSYCTNLTVGPIYFLLKNCPRLTHLSLTGISAFLRREITQYCREPPPDFTESQKLSFCVFSGHGVVQLRNYLDALMEQRAFILEQYGLQEELLSFLTYRRHRLVNLQGGETDQRLVSPEDVMQDSDGAANLGIPPRLRQAVLDAANAERPNNGQQAQAFPDWEAVRRAGLFPRGPLTNTPAPRPEGREDENLFMELVALDQLNRNPGTLRQMENVLVETLFGRNIPNMGGAGTPQRPENAPQIVQPPVFLPPDPNNDDVDMDGGDLFPSR